MVTTESGEFFSTVQEPNDGTSIYVGNLTVTGNVVSGTQNAAFFRNGTCDDVICFGSATSSVSGTIAQRSTLALESNYWTYDSEYNYPSSFAAIAGTYIASVGSGGIGEGTSISIDSSGVITGSCLVAGQVTLINPNYNAYDIAITYSSDAACGDPVTGELGATAKGIATIDFAANPQVLEIVMAWTTTTNASNPAASPGTVIGNYITVLTLQ
jgi:hypothetical protein